MHREKPIPNDDDTALTRRQFLTRGAKAAGVVALPCIIPASALGLNGAVAPSERIVMGGIGIGGRGTYDLGAMLNERDVQWVAVCDVLKGKQIGRASCRERVEISVVA